MHVAVFLMGELARMRQTDIWQQIDITSQQFLDVYITLDQRFQASTNRCGNWQLENNDNLWTTAYPIVMA